MRATSLVAPIDLAWLDAASREIATSDDLESVAGIRNRAEAVRRVLDAVNAGVELQNRVSELKLRAERRAGVLLRRLRLRGGDRRSKSPAESLTLKQMGINRNQSSRWQREASVPEVCFQEFLDYAKENGKEISSAALLRYAKRKGDINWTGRPGVPVRCPKRRHIPFPRDADRPARTSAAGSVFEELDNQLETLQSILRTLQSEKPKAWSPSQMRTCQLYVRQTLEIVNVARRAMVDQE